VRMICAKPRTLAGPTSLLVASLLLGATAGLALGQTSPPAQSPSTSSSPSSGGQSSPQTPSQAAPAPATEKGQTAAPGQEPAQQPAPEKQPPATPPAPSGNLQLEAPPVATPEKPEAKPEQNPNVIAEIMFRGNRRIPSSTLRARIFSHKGDPYDENALERDYMALWNTGFFDDIRLEVADSPQGKICTFFVREKKLIRSISYKGLSTVSESDVLDRFKEAKVGLTIESQYDPVTIKRAEVILQMLLAEHGRQFATVRARTRNIPPNSVALTFIVVEGPKVKVGRIRFQGNSVFSSIRLERAMKYSRPSGAPPWFYWFHKTYDKEKIDADLEQIRELYQEHGYFYALPKDPITHTVDTRRPLLFFFLGHGRGKRVDITIPIEEGAQYHLGRFVIRGNKLFKQAQLQPVLQLKTGDVFNLTKVRKSLENYKKLYGEFGYINFVADPDINPDRKKHVIDLALDFEEGQQFFVHRIEFSGNTKTRDKVIRRELLVDEGNVFNTALWDFSILRVNQLGFFNMIKKEDYDITQNNQNHTIDINLKVKEKGKNSIGFSGGVSGIAGNFVGINYATNNFLGLGETLSVQLQVGTFQRLYSFGFTEPYLLDRPITTGFTVFKSDYHFDQLRQAAIFAGINPNSVQQSNPALQNFFQNFQQNSTGFTVFASYPLRRTFARLGMTYSYSVSSVQAFSAASQAFYSALAFGQFQGPNQLSGITTSQIAPNFLYNTLNGDINATRGKYISAALQFSGSILGGNVNTIRPVIELKYFHPVNHGRNTLAFHFVGSTISGFGGRVPPPFDRIYMGGEYDIRGFDNFTISPVGFFPTIGQVCNRDNSGRPIPALNSAGQPIAGSCGSYTRFPFNTLQFAGGDTELLTNFEYRIPIAGPVTLAPFLDIGSNFILRPGQLKLQPQALSGIGTQFPYFPLPTELRPLGRDNYQPRSSTGIELQVVLPVVNAPFRVYWAYNWLRLNTMITPPQDLPPESMFPNAATYNSVLQYFEPIPLRERKIRVGFTVARQF
jgi:outer membrane protein insertion porin family